MQCESNEERIGRALAIKDLTDPENGVHAINLVVKAIAEFFETKKGWPKPDIRRSGPISSVANNFDRLYFPHDNPSRLPRYTRYINEEKILRTHTTAIIPDIIAEIKNNQLDDYLVLCPGICYRRDVVDKKHTGEPHQMDIWKIKKGQPKFDRSSLIELIEAVIEATIPGAVYRANEVIHPYTINGLEVEVNINNDWLEILECGEANPKIIVDAGLNPDEYSGLAMGIGLDRLVMLIKKIDDIRILRSDDPRIKEQMMNLDLYVPVSNYPFIKQDISVAVSEDFNEEDVCEKIKDVTGKDADAIEEITVVSEASFNQLPEKAIERLGIVTGQKNMLIKIIFRSHERSLTHKEVNEIRDKIYMAVNQGKTGGYLDFIKQ